ncbi:MAG: acylneuraminate cytidylyltransferase family protein [Gammaproteobacteria bacterium]|nr:acylneuraminate cytidylyltransferase family protein [Gammaproteobacteria bacterium]MDX2486868.1 acylneuraminate cytidylyltransferase family protein [Gammaproteobacteria bacterium]
MSSLVALIPARSGSKRVPGKNIRRLAGHPLIAYTIAAALESGVFGAVVVSTDSEDYAEIARHYGAEVPFLRPAELAGSLSPDIEWVEHAILALENLDRSYDGFSILRPTSPFRQAKTIQRAWQTFNTEQGVDSLRAVELCKQHPGKMWVVQQRCMTPLLPFSPDEQPWHSSQYQALPEIFVQNASLEMAWTKVVRDSRTIAGEIVLPFFTEGFEGFDINEPKDWRDAEYLLSQDSAVLPEVRQKPFA